MPWLRIRRGGGDRLSAPRCRSASRRSFSAIDFYGTPTKRMDLHELVAQVAASLTDHCSKVLILDTLDLIHAYMSMRVTLVLDGVDIAGSGLMDEGPLPATSAAGRATGGSRPGPSTVRPYGLMIRRTLPGRTRV
ncbi:hypothetical protein [Streptomyces werraensis]|uniref:hypothetical protein n=1 Tax=Streptomyces werraensis TaxID=68284 RepID=UPI00344184FC